MADDYDACINNYLDADPQDTFHKNEQTLLKEFWTCVYKSMWPQRIRKCFITGVLPISITDGITLMRNVSFESQLSVLCGLSCNDVKAALRLPNICGSDASEVEKHFNVMKRYFDGYHFRRYDNSPTVFNIESCLEYFVVIIHQLIIDFDIDTKTTRNSLVS